MLNNRHICFFIVLAGLFSSSFLLGQDRFDCIKGTITNSKTTHFDICTLNYARYVVEFRAFQGGHLEKRMQTASKEFNITKNSSGSNIEIRGEMGRWKIKSSGGKSIELTLDRPFRRSEIGYPYADLFYTPRVRRDSIWNLLKDLCKGIPSDKNAFDYGVTNKQLNKIVKFSKSRLLLYLGSCNLKSVYESDPLEAERTDDEKSKKRSL